MFCSLWFVFCFFFCLFFFVVVIFHLSLYSLSLFNLWFLITSKFSIFKRFLSHFPCFGNPFYVFLFFIIIWKHDPTLMKDEIPI
jgi:hypothetical protein